MLALVLQAGMFRRQSMRQRRVLKLLERTVAIGQVCGLHSAALHPNHVWL